MNLFVEPFIVKHISLNITGVRFVPPVSEEMASGLRRLVAAILKEVDPFLNMQHASFCSVVTPSIG